MRPNVLIKAVRPGALAPEYGTPLAACADVRAYLKEGAVVSAFEPFNDSRSLGCLTADGKIPPNGFSDPEALKPGSIVIHPGWRVMITTGLAFFPPEGYSLRTHPRSGLSTKQGMTISCGEGVIDEDYQMELIIPLVNLSSCPVVVRDGDRIAQIEAVLDSRAVFEFVQDLPQKNSSRKGGFGHTGTV